MNTVILGLGANIGDRLQQLRLALHAIRTLPDLTVTHISPVYISDALLPADSPSEWNLPYLNAAIRCETQHTPDSLYHQLKKIEQTLGRKPDLRWSPRMIDIDLLAWNHDIVKTDFVTIPHLHLFDRPFALWPLADIAPLWRYQDITAAQYVEKWGSRFTGGAPFRTKQIAQRIDTPQLVGILNITPDSFSDGGDFINPHSAVQQAEQLILAGADILDIGAESTAPSSSPIDIHTEWQRLEPVLQAIHAAKSRFLVPPKISIDTRHAAVAAKALILGADWINDVSGLTDPAMREIVQQSTADCVVMHHLSLPERRDHALPRDQDVVSFVLAWGEKQLDQLEQQGIARSRIIFDPGIGFGKHAEQSFALLKNAAVFTQLGTRLLLGYSRKSFFTLFSSQPARERDLETLALTLQLTKQPIDYLRLHNIDMTARALRIQAAFA